MMRRGLVALLLVLGACAGGSEPEGIEACFQDVAASYEQATNAIEPGLRESAPQMAREVRKLLEAAEARDSQALREAGDAYTDAADGLLEAGDDFFKELDEAHELDVDCP